VSGPALTRAIQKLEEELGGKLFRRERNLTHLTDFGTLIRPHLKRVLSEAEGAKVTAEQFLRLEHAPQGHLIVAEYEVLDHVFSKAIRPKSGRDDRWLLVLAKSQARPRGERSIVLTGRTYLLHHFPSSSYWATIKCPCGTDFLTADGAVRPDRHLLYVDAHARPRDAPSA
jgi:DNA-binding transcriptional LysR family regulator